MSAFDELRKLSADILQTADMMRDILADHTMAPTAKLSMLNDLFPQLLEAHALEVGRLSHEVKSGRKSLTPFLNNETFDQLH